MHIHVLVLHRNFELILIKIGFFLQIFKVASKLGQRPCTIVQGHWPNFAKMKRREFSIFIRFSDTYTCTYVV